MICTESEAMTEAMKCLALGEIFDTTILKPISEKSGHKEQQSLKERSLPSRPKRAKELKRK